MLKAILSAAVLVSATTLCACGGQGDNYQNTSNPNANFQNPGIQNTNLQNPHQNSNLQNPSNQPTNFQNPSNQPRDRGVSFNADNSNDPNPMTTSTTTDSFRSASNGSATQVNNFDLSKKIHQVLIDDSSLSPQSRSVSVNVENGKVVLSGNVPNATEKNSIETTVKSVSGVRDVTNNLTVENDR